MSAKGKSRPSEVFHPIFEVHDGTRQIFLPLKPLLIDLPMKLKQMTLLEMQKNAKRPPKGHKGRGDVVKMG